MYRSEHAPISRDGSMLHVTHKSSYNPDGNPLTIGEDVTVGHKVMLHGCTIGNRVLVGMGSILLDGAIVEDDVMIGAGSLVPQNKRLESGYLYLGSPVKQIRPLSDEEKAGLRYSANNYVKWKDEYRIRVTRPNLDHLHFVPELSFPLLLPSPSDADENSLTTALAYLQ